MFSNGYAIYMLAPFRMDTLAAGALLALIWPNLQAKIHADSNTRKNSIRGFAALLGVGLITALVLNGKGFLPTNGNQTGATWLLEATLWISVGMFMLALLGIGKKVLSGWPLVYLGRISYSIYLFHQTAIYLAPKNNGVLAFIISIGYATVLWFLIESPILNAGRKKGATTIARVDSPQVTEAG